MGVTENKYSNGLSLAYLCVHMYQLVYSRLLISGLQLSRIISFLLALERYK